MMLTNLNGYFEDKIHHYPVRIHYADTDAGGVVYHGRYLELAERARAGFLSLIDVPEVITEGDMTYFWVVRKITIDYKSPARVAEIIDIKSHISNLRPASIEVTQKLMRQDSLLAEITLLLALVNKEGRVQKMMPEIRQKIVSYS